MTRLLYPLIEVVDRSGQADEIHANSFRKSQLSIAIDVLCVSKVNKVQEEESRGPFL